MHADAVTPCDAILADRVRVDQDDLDLAPVCSIDEAWSVDDTDPVLDRHAASRQYEPAVPHRDRDRDSGGH